VGGADAQLFTAEDMAAIRSRKDDIAERVEGRKSEIGHLLEPPKETQVEIVSESDTADELPGEERMEQIRRSVSQPAAQVTESAQPAAPAQPAQPSQATEAPQLTQPARAAQPAPPAQAPPPPPPQRPGPPSGHGPPPRQGPPPGQGGGPDPQQPPQGRARHFIEQARRSRGHQGADLNRPEEGENRD